MENKNVRLVLLYTDNDVYKRVLVVLWGVNAGPEEAVRREREQ